MNPNGENVLYCMCFSKIMIKIRYFVKKIYGFLSMPRVTFEIRTHSFVKIIILTLSFNVCDCGKGAPANIKILAP